jgi:hypothetical protein
MPTAVGDKQKEPFKITVGYDADNGGFGASVKGSRVYFNDNPDKQPFDAWRIPYAEVVIDAHCSPQPDALNNSAVSFRPGVMRFISQENVAAPGTCSDSLNHVEVYVDLAKVRPVFKGQTAGQVVNVNQSIVGVDYAFVGKLVNAFCPSTLDSRAYRIQRLCLMTLLRAETINSSRRRRTGAASLSCP